MKQGSDAMPCLLRGAGLVDAAELGGQSDAGLEPGG